MLERCFDLLGKRFGMWTVIAFSHREPKLSFDKKSGKERIRGYRYFVDCVCDCGNKKTVNLENLQLGKSTCCGCKNKQRLCERNLRGGFSLKDRRIHQMYKDMITRCYSERCKAYRWYGAKGVKVCDLWLKDEQNFFDFCNNYGYNEELTIDRINSNGDYSPDNCRFIDRKFNALRGVFKREHGYDGTDEEVMNCYVKYSL